jgi:hypothetical protein
MADMIRDRISIEARAANFFSVMADGTTDITLCEQMAVVVRYVLQQKAPSKPIVVERMLACCTMDCTTGVAIAPEIKSMLSSVGLDMKNCVGESHDGASNMSSENVGVAALIKKEAPLAVSVYCMAHGSNLVIKACCHSSTSAVNLYGTDKKPGELQKLRNFFYKHARKRHDILQTEVAKDPKLRGKTLQKTHSVRFSVAHGATNRDLELLGPAVQSRGTRGRAGDGPEREVDHRGVFHSYRHSSRQAE